MFLFFAAGIVVVVCDGLFGLGGVEELVQERVNLTVENLAANEWESIAQEFIGL
jgi:hypothetical protein